MEMILFAPLSALIPNLGGAEYRGPQAAPRGWGL